MKKQYAHYKDIDKEQLQEDIDAILAIINKHKSLDYAQSVAEKRATRGLAVMKEELAKLPNQEASNKILTILESLATRKI